MYRWFEFLEFYLARRVPHLNPLLRPSLRADAFGSVFGISDFTFEEGRFFDFDDTEFEEALATRRGARVHMAHRSPIPFGRDRWCASR